MKMMQGIRIRRKLTFIIIMAVLFTGCGLGQIKKGETENEEIRNNVQEEGGHDGNIQDDSSQEDSADGVSSGAKGRYIEKLLEAPEGYKGGGSMRILADGSLMLVDVKQGMVSRSKDGGISWKTKENKFLHSMAEQAQIEITSVAIAGDGRFFLSYIPWTESTDKKPYPEKYVCFDKEGEKQDEFELGVEKNRECATGAVFCGKAVFLAMQNASVYRIDPEGHIAKKVLSGGKAAELGIYQCGDTVAVTDTDKLYLYDAANDKMDASDEVLNGYIKGEKAEKVVVGGDSDGKVLAASSSGIFSHTIGGNVMEQIADGDLLSLGNPSNEPEELLVAEDGTILILYGSGELDSYVYDPEASTVPEKQLSVYSLYDNITVRQAVYIYRKKHPDVYVKVINGLSGSDGVTESDAIRNLNTELLAGKGPDVLLMDGMPMDSYVEKGMLADLSVFVSELQKEEEYYDGILRAYESGGKLYTVPIRYKLAILAAKGGISGITDIKSLADAVENAAAKNKGYPAFGTYNAEELLEKLWDVCAGAWIKEGKDADEQAVSEFLTHAKRIYQAEQRAVSPALKQHHEALMEQDKTAERKYDPAKGDMQLYFMLGDLQDITAGIYQSMSDLRDLFSVCEQEKDFSWQFWQGQLKDVFVPSGLAAVTSASENKELAQEFVRTMLGTEVQQKDLEDGFPVNKSAFAVFSENPRPDSIVTMCSGGSSFGKDYSIDLMWPSKQWMGQLENLIGTLKVPADKVDSVRDAVMAIGKEALTGEKEVGASAEEICRKIQLLCQE